MNKEHFKILEDFHNDCIRFWMHELNDDGREPYIRALEDVKACKTNPFQVYHAEILDVRTKEYFVKRCEMDLGLNQDFRKMKWEEDENND